MTNFSLFCPLVSKIFFLSYLVLSPSSHDEGIVDGDADDLLDALALQLVGLGNIACKI